MSRKPNLISKILELVITKYPFGISKILSTFFCPVNMTRDMKNFVQIWFYLIKFKSEQNFFHFR